MEKETQPLIKRFNLPTNIGKVFLAVLLLALLGGIGTGYYLSSSEGGSNKIDLGTAGSSEGQVSKLCNGFADGVIKKRPEPKTPDEYVEGTHLLMRDNTSPAALTSSYVDLSKYEDKKVRVYGETQKALKEGWLMDVCKIEEK